MKKMKMRLPVLLLALVLAAMSLMLTVQTSAAAYVNLADPYSSDWLTDKRMSGGSAVYNCVGAYVTNYIPVKDGDIVRVRGLDVVSELTNFPNTPKSALYDVNKNELYLDLASGGSKYWRYADDEDISVITITCADAAFLRLCGELVNGYSVDDVVITVNQDIVEDDGASSDDVPASSSVSWVDSILAVFTGVGSWLSSTVGDMTTMFWTAESGLSVLGVLAVASLAVAFVVLLIYLLAGWIKFK